MIYVHDKFVRHIKFIIILPRCGPAGLGSAETFPVSGQCAEPEVDPDPQHGPPQLPVLLPRNKIALNQ